MGSATQGPCQLAHSVRWQPEKKGFGSTAPCCHLEVTGEGGNATEDQDENGQEMSSYLGARPALDLAYLT